jgi:hypothetical protein
VDSMVGTLGDNRLGFEDAFPKPKGRSMGRGERKGSEGRYLPDSWDTHNVFENHQEL